MAFIVLLFALVSLISLLYSFKPSIVSKRTTIFTRLKLKTAQTIDETIISEQQQTIPKRANNLPDGSYDYNQWSKAFISQPLEMNYRRFPIIVTFSGTGTVRISRLLDLNIHLEDVLTILKWKKNQYQTCFSFINNEISS